MPRSPCEDASSSVGAAVHSFGTLMLRLTVLAYLWYRSLESHQIRAAPECHRSGETFNKCLLQVELATFGSEVHALVTETKGISTGPVVKGFYSFPLLFVICRSRHRCRLITSSNSDVL
ncbi:hypothetical protein TNCV_1135051 [Trichonephila clavipes]|nr:hypothetical protein TNCV_1135051 [Trichonephila clavipes]